MKRFRSIVSTVVWVILMTYLTVVVALHIGPVQRMIGSAVAQALMDKLGTKVSVGRVDIGLWNRIVVDDVLILDQQQDSLLKAGRLATSVDIGSLLNGRISLSSVQLFSVKTKLYQYAGMRQPNYQFVVDSLSSGKKTNKSPLDIAIRSVVIRNGAAYINLPRLHYSISDVSCHASMPVLTHDSLSLDLGRLSLKEKSGLKINHLSFHLDMGQSMAHLSDFKLQLPQTDIRIPSISAKFRRKNGKPDLQTVLYNGSIEANRITIADIASLVPALKYFHNSLAVNATFNGSADKLQINNVYLASDDNTIHLSAFGKMNLKGAKTWHVHVNNLHLSPGSISFIVRNLKGHNIQVPDAIERLGSIGYKGDASGNNNRAGLDGNLTTEAGNVILYGEIRRKLITATVSTPSLDIGRIAHISDLGRIAANLSINADLGQNNIAAKGTIASIVYKGYDYRGISLNASLHNGIAKGNIMSADPNVRGVITGSAYLKGHNYNIVADVKNFNPFTLGLTSTNPGRRYSLWANAKLRGSNLDNAIGMIDIRNFSMLSDKGNCHIAHALFSSENGNRGRILKFDSDVANVNIVGYFRPSTLISSLSNIVGSRIPTMPGLPLGKRRGGNHFRIDASLLRSDWLNTLFGIPLIADNNITLHGIVDEPHNKIDLMLDAPKVTYGNIRTEKGHLGIETSGDSILVKVSGDKIGDNGHTVLALNAFAAHNNLSTSLSFQTPGKKNLRGTLNADTRFFKDKDYRSTALINLRNSDLMVGDTVWTVEPGTILYNGKSLAIDNFKIGHGHQHITANGIATGSKNDSILVDLNEINVAYILNLINFHAVDFDGLATGQAVVTKISSQPSVNGNIRVDDFRFEEGRLGTLHTKIGYDSQVGKLTFDALAEESDEHKMPIKGYVDIKHNDIDLSLKPHGTNMEFLESFCGTFIDDINCRGNGDLWLHGDLKRIYLEGGATLTGNMRMSPLGTVYSLHEDSIRLVPDKIEFPNDTITDTYGNKGILNGALTHRSFTNLKYNIYVTANNLLAYDRDYDGNTFRGHVLFDGSCSIKGQSGLTVIEVDGTPRHGSVIEYNAASTQVDESSFIHWNTPSQSDTTLAIMPQTDFPSDLHLNMTVNATPDLTLRVITDPATGDFVSLNGSGAIKANYFNKGAFQMFGNYDVDHGIYRLTIQNVIRREFQFQEGSRVVFGGDPMQARLNLNALYTVNGVSLNDLQIGRSLTSNNVRVNCMMNINGTPEAPKVSFDMDIPSLSTDARQMVRSVINSEEDMNQQVLYLLAVGRFQAPANNNAQQQNTQQSRTSLAMQSVLSGTLSQQINNVLSSFVKSDNWNFGANISTGDEGFNNAEYEGLLNGRLLNNRLLINGQFGYRDKATTGNTSFIGDFDVRYLIFPNGNLAVKVYNQTNDRYFTRNSLNTQGIGLILKKDFSSWRDLIGIKPRKGKNTKKYKKK